ncbi:MAG TPA: hypothetical protein VF173_29890 [Thermoanaerobaculia bacterium]|nr:hypothetical protein [Thermoanaerobaculia bacterium]
MTGTVYLQRHGPDLARAAALVERYLLGLLGDLPQEGARVLPFEQAIRA